MPQQGILVSGGDAGFLKSHLCEKRVAQGHDVICVDNCFSGRKANVAPLMDAPNFDTIRHDGTMAVMALGSDVSGPINVGNPHEVTMFELAETISDLVGDTAKLEFFDTPQDDTKRRCPDISVMKSLTGWEPRCTLKTSRTKAIEDFRRQLELGESTRSSEAG